VADIKPANATNKSVTWKSDKPATVSVHDGVIKGEDAGTAVITATSVDGDFEATCTVTVATAAVSVASVSIAPEAVTVEAGKTVQLSALITPAEATNHNVAWAITPESVATIDANGTLTGLSAGKATVTVTTQDGGKTATCEATIMAKTIAVESINVTPGIVTLVAGNTVQLSTAITPANATDQNVSWTITPESVAIIDANGKVTGVSAGKATVTVTTQDGGKTATCGVTVMAKTIAVENVSITPKTVTVRAGKTAQLSAMITPANAANHNVTWTVSPESVATIDANGTVRGVSEGEATVTVTTQDGGKTATCEITVLPVRV
jgi:uncharacterized protein YjdB